MKDLNNEHLKSPEKDWKENRKRTPVQLSCSTHRLGNGNKPEASADDWRMKRWYICAMEWHSPVKRNHDICRQMHRTREDYIESVRGTQKDKCHVFSLNGSFEFQIRVRQDITWSNHRKVKMDHGRWMIEKRLDEGRNGEKVERQYSRRGREKEKMTLGFLKNA